MPSYLPSKARIEAAKSAASILSQASLLLPRFSAVFVKFSDYLPTTFRREDSFSFRTHTGGRLLGGLAGLIEKVEPATLSMLPDFNNMETAANTQPEPGAVDFNELEHTSSPSSPDLWAGVRQPGRISNMRTQ
mgnify:CR=1 FL=1